MNCANEPVSINHMATHSPHGSLHTGIASNDVFSFWFLFFSFFFFRTTS